MVNSNTGINLSIFTNVIIKYGDDLVHTPRTKTTSNIDGDDTFTNGSTATIRAYITRKTKPWNFDPTGFIEGGDALMLLTLANTTVLRNDLITWNGNTYQVWNVLNRDQPGGNVAFKSCNLYKVE